MVDHPLDRVRLTYVLTPSEGESVEEKARTIASEQTVELPDGCYPRDVGERVVGHVEAVEQLDETQWRVTISYWPGLVEAEVPQLLNLLFGNISMLQGIVVRDVELPEALLERYPGPRFGTQGFREACGGTSDRPLVCSAAKPVGLSAAQLAERCRALARGGVDVVKDDHGVMGQEVAPFRERVERCQEAVLRANDETGGHTLYFPNVTAAGRKLEERLAVARDVACRGALVSPFLMGLGTLRELAESSGLMLLVHPTFSGGLFQTGHGVAPTLLFGRLLRILGADGVIYVNAGGRFPVTADDCDEINARLLEPLGGLRPALPVPGGGVDVDSVGAWIDRYGTELMFLIGSSLYTQPDLEAATRKLVRALERHTHG